MKFGAKRDPLLAQLGFFFAPNFIQNLYTVLKKKIVGISQYAYFRKPPSSRHMKCFGDVVNVSKIDKVKKVKKIGAQAYVVNGMSSIGYLGRFLKQPAVHCLVKHPPQKILQKNSKK
jgi:hypothetical protein